MDLKKQFQLNEIVIIHSSNPKVSLINGNKGYICSDGDYDDKKQVFIYAVFDFSTQMAYICYENELTATGQFYVESKDF